MVSDMNMFITVDTLILAVFMTVFIAVLVGKGLTVLVGYLWATKVKKLTYYGAKYIGHSGSGFSDYGYFKSDGEALEKFKHYPFVFRCDAGGSVEIKASQSKW